MGRGVAREFVGTFFAALFSTFTPVIAPELLHGMLEISRQILGHSWPEMFFKGVAAGFLIAALVWLIPGAETAQFYVIVLMTYLISVGNFMHIVAGSVEAFLLFSMVNWVAQFADRIFIAGTGGQRRRRHRAVHAHCLRASRERDLRRLGRRVPQYSDRYAFGRRHLASRGVMRDGNERITFRIIGPQASFRDVVGMHDQAIDPPPHTVRRHHVVGDQTYDLAFRNAKTINVVAVHEQHLSGTVNATETVAIGVDGGVELALAAKRR